MQPHMTTVAQMTSVADMLIFPGNMTEFRIQLMLPLGQVDHADYRKNTYMRLARTVAEI